MRFTLGGWLAGPGARAGGAGLAGDGLSEFGEQNRVGHNLSVRQLGGDCLSYGGLMPGAVPPYVRRLVDLKINAAWRSCVAACYGTANTRGAIDAVSI